MPDNGGISNKPSDVQASSTARSTNAAMSLRNSATYSARRTRRIALEFLVDKFLRHCRIHNPRRGLPNQVARVVLAKPAPKRIPKTPRRAYGRCRQSPSRRCQMSPCWRGQRSKLPLSGFALIVVAPESQLVQHRNANRPPANSTIAAGHNFDRHAALNSISLAVTFSTMALQESAAQNALAM